jgi:hypothetical protein
MPIIPSVKILSFQPRRADAARGPALLPPVASASRPYIVRQPILDARRAVY